LCTDFVTLAFWRKLVRAYAINFVYSNEIGRLISLLPHFFLIDLSAHISKMSIYEEVEIEDMDFEEEEQHYTYPCPCGDKFVITLAELWDGEDVAPCPSCTLRIRVVYEEEALPPLKASEAGGSAGAGMAVAVH